mmetsp:Transcript_1451/g.2424  ORF Transcript_1451/g.2424 Transcript_1451/m.2424 type:complete len:220 (+) Transcript_1451:219-878(+)|eukprot:CAMPEP_0184699982 /NCGR_PEP_ID=MMETSP0313-20130426/7026_1 /TAXON_ID=2792 /ORGANISM="Porphyridium aerugineum, Strain SAG 1380-2" /LENGTH=219 /DNA_ID=CAMNT_0027159257 /DNA_START=191 /DNA_END=850 /DNA_ORIENTATION=+
MDITCLYNNNNSIPSILSQPISTPLDMNEETIRNTRMNRGSYRSLKDAVALFNKQLMEHQIRAGLGVKTPREEEEQEEKEEEGASSGSSSGFRRCQSEKVVSKSSMERMNSVPGRVTKHVSFGGCRCVRICESNDAPSMDHNSTNRYYNDKSRQNIVGDDRDMDEMDDMNEMNEMDDADDMDAGMSMPMPMSTSRAECVPRRNRAMAMAEMMSLMMGQA